jgi:hypothetical protein
MTVLGNKAEFYEPAPPKPKPITLICVDGRIVADATVIVSPKDVNWWRRMAVRQNGEIQIRRS